MPRTRVATAVVVGLLLLTDAGRLFATPPAPLPLRVMTYNLRYASETPPAAWSSRRPMMARLITAQHPDIFGTQEGLYAQLKDLACDLEEYEWIGLGREGGSRGEFMAVFYRRDRFEPIAFDHFWLSDTPDVIGSATWGNSNRRMVTWVRFRDKGTGREFLFWNTHFDHEVEAARQKAAALVRDRLARTEPDLPIILAGDFNCSAGHSRAYDILTAEARLGDAWLMAGERVNDGLDTFNDFKPPQHKGERIDWILVRLALRVSRAEIVTASEGGRFPSDHFPVVVDLVL